MTVGELQELLSGVDKKAVVVIDGQVVHGIEVVHGRVSDGYYNERFTEVPQHKARNVAVRFTHFTELSTGEVVESYI